MVSTGGTNDMSHLTSRSLGPWPASGAGLGGVDASTAAVHVVTRRQAGRTTPPNPTGRGNVGGQQAVVCLLRV
jgi:hypothetical protein